MPFVDLCCTKCGLEEPEMVTFLADRPPCPKCGGERVKMMGTALIDIPPWMTDDGISSNARHREWLKTPEAKAMDLTHAKDD